MVSPIVKKVGDPDITQLEFCQSLLRDYIRTIQLLALELRLDN
jgi:hypothetical protein